MDNKIDRSRNGDQCFIGSRSRNETLSDDVAQDAVVRPKEYRSPFNVESRVGRMTGRPLYTSRDTTQGKKQVNQVKASSRAKSQHFSKKWDLNREYLEQLTRQSPEQIGIRFINNREDFIKLMKRCRNDSALIDILLNIFAKIALPESQHFLSLLNAINESQFLENKAVPYILSLIGMGRQNIEIVRNIVRILSAMADTSVNSVVSFYSALTALSVLIDEIQTSKLCSEAMREEFEEFGRLKSRIQSVRRTNEKRRRNAEDRLLPPDNFRSVSIIPTEKDLLPGGAPFLRKNKAYGTFNNLDHYLDVQFRLLREDYIAPLRESIQEYRNSLPEIKRGKRRIKDIRVYTNVRIAGTTLNTDGIGHILTFDTSGTKRVNWEYSKRLNFGALLALSHDNFTTVHFATITSRKVEDLELGIIEVQFIGKADDIAQMADKVFVLAESDEYFEAYKHNLIVLQNITVLPFSKYIIECKEETDTAAYLTKDEDITYDLSLMARYDVQFYIKDFGDIYTISRKEDMSDTQDSLNESNTPNNFMKYYPLMFSVLKDEEWPSASELGLDDTQYRAVRNALTKEFSITQGPPGTGKTYVGLKIAKALLANRRLWYNSENRRPLLVVCYTNHALDQFLCGIHDFFQGKIVRVGGRSTNEVMRQHGVSTMYRHISYDILETSSALRITMNLFDRQIMNVKDQLCRIDTELLRERQIEKYAGELHESLMSGFHSKMLYINTRRGIGKQLEGYHFNVVAEWLGCGTLFEKTRFQVSFPTVGEKLKCIQSGIKDLGNNSDTALTQDNICRNELLHHISKDDIKRLAIYGDETQKPKKQKRSIEFSTIKPASEKEQTKVKDAWKLPIRLRWRLYKRWSEQFKIHLNALLTRYENDYEETCRRIRENTQQKNIQALSQADVIGMTTTGAAKHFDVLREVKPKIVVVEEAAEVLEAHIVTALSQECEQLILIGDHKQLKPSPAVYRLAKNFNLDISLFERMINNKITFECLEYQHRMRPEISELIRLFYPKLKDADSVLDRPNIKGVAKNVFFVSHKNQEQQDDDNTSHSNEYEAEFLVAFCRYLLKQEYQPTKITVLTTYSAQMFLLRRLMPKDSEFEGIKISVVDNFQGEENDIILLSLVRSNIEEKIGFLKIDNRVNVALSRARNGLFVIGNLAVMSKVSALWADITDLLKEKNEIGPALPLTCRNHPNKTFFASTVEDFQKVPEGGCDEQCDARIECGHACRLKCHVYDTNHEKYQCGVRCTKTCENGHQCIDLCHEKKETCSLCRVEISKIIPKCGHSQLVPCCEDPKFWECKAACEDILKCGHLCQAYCSKQNHDCHETVTYNNETCGHVIEIECCMRSEHRLCLLPCDHILSCGHKCQKKCHEMHTMPCQIVVTKSLPCGHSLLAPCHEKNIKCPFPCEMVLSCGHQCKNTCGDEHTPYCDVEVYKILKCGHPLISSCSDLKCQFQCNEKLNCGHTCQEKCSRPHTTMCMMRVSYTCVYGHETKRFCYEVFRQIMIECIEPCQIVLACGHKCHGTCHSCENGRFHVPCDHCGLPESQEHSDKKIGSKTLPCIAPCRNQCSHRKCDKMCFEPCADDGTTNWPCQEKCEWSCQHISCSKLCYEDCDRSLCAVPCQRTLGYRLLSPKCAGYCGETCGGDSYGFRFSGIKCKTFHNSCKKPMAVKDIITKHFQTDDSCGSVCSSCHKPVLLDEKVFGKTVKKIHGKKEALKLQSIFYNRHAELKEKLDSIRNKVANIDRSDSRCLYCRNRLEKLQGFFNQFLHFQLQTYLDMKTELDELKETTDALFAYQVISVLFQHAD